MSTKHTLPILVLAATCLAPSAHALTFNLIHDSSMDARALAGFQQASAIWSNRFTDSMQVNLTIGYSPLGAGIIGSTGSTSTTYGYSSFRTALSGDITSTLDTTAVASLETGSTYGFYTNATTTNNNPHSATSNLVRLSNANAKALGLYTGSASASDASITFSSNFAFDFDRSNGIDSDKMDFVGVAAHEIGHALGFSSGVDILDANAGAYSDATFAGYHTALDMFRYTPFNGGGSTRSFLAGGYAAYFAFGGNDVANGTSFSTGYYNGDGNQASHWKDDFYTGTNLGMMDPTTDYGYFMNTSDNDFRAFDVIGYNVSAVPEPTTVAAFALGVVGLLRRRRK